MSLTAGISCRTRRQRRARPSGVQSASSRSCSSRLPSPACEHKPTKEEEDAAKNTFVCQLVGERLVIRFDSGEARMLTSSNEKITLYQIPSPSGVRYSNGNVELRGKGADLVLIENGTSTTLDGCKPLTVSQAVAQ